MKIMEKEDIIEHDMKEQIREEVRIQWKLKHKNLVRLKEVMEDDQHLYVVMEHMLRGDLFDVLYNEHDSHLPEDEAKIIFSDLMEGIAYMHENNIAHRDIKLENLLMDETGTVKIIDFGSALDTVNCKDENEFSVICGTREYMAPEMLKETKYGTSVDIWSCGVVLYELLNRCTPFDSDVYKKKRKDVIKYMKNNTKDIHYSKRLSPEAIDLLKKCFELDPKKRINASDVLKHPFFQNKKSNDEIAKLRMKKYEPVTSHKKFEWLKTIMLNADDEQNIVEEGETKKEEIKPKKEENEEIIETKKEEIIEPKKEENIETKKDENIEPKKEENETKKEEEIIEPKKEEHETKNVNK